MEGLEIARWERPEAPDAPAAAITIAAVVKDYLEWTETQRRASTAREWRYMADAHLLPPLGKIEVAKLTTARLRKWHEGLAEQPARLRTKPGTTLRYREQNDDDPDAIRARRITTNRNLTVHELALRSRGASSARSDRSAKPARPRPSGHA